MAGDWIPMRLDIFEDPAVIQMAEQMGIREEYVVGLLHKVWSWASRQCHGGRVTNVTLMSLERVTNVTGFTSVMRDAGWIAEEKDSSGRPCVVFPKWENWLSNSAKERLNAAKRQAKRRKADGKPSHGDVTEVSRSKRDKNVTTGEERREEKSNKKVSVIRPENVPVDLWEDYMAVRRSKRAGAITKTAMAGLEREATKAGMSIQEAITTCVERNWVSLKADWIEEKGKNQPQKQIVNFDLITQEMLHG